MGKGPRRRTEKSNIPQGPVGKCWGGERLWKESLSDQRTVDKGGKKVLWPWRGKGTRPRGKDRGPPQGLVGSGPAAGKATLSHSPPRGALLGLATVRGLAAAPAAPQQRILRLSLRLRRRPRPSVSVARLARSPGLSSRARAASARDRAKK